MSMTADKAARLYNRLTNRYLVPDGIVTGLTVTSSPDVITLTARFIDGTGTTIELDATRGILDLSRLAQMTIAEHLTPATRPAHAA